MATIAVGDVHGHLAALDGLLNRLTAELTADDTVVFLGDYIDRGPDSKGCIDRILTFSQEILPSKVVCLRGNHEDWLLRTMDDYTRHSWLMGMDAFETIRSYSAAAADTLNEAISSAALELFVNRVPLPYDLFFSAMPPEHQSFLRNLPPYYRGADGICVHGGLDPQVLRLEDQTLDALLWGSIGFPESYAGKELVAYGHWNNAVLDLTGWPQPNGAGAAIGIDTISHGVLTAVRLCDKRIFQSGRP